MKSIILVILSAFVINVNLTTAQCNFTANSFDVDPYTQGWTSQDSSQWLQFTTSSGALNGPSTSCSGSGSFLLSPAASGAAQSFAIETPCMDLTTFSCPTVKFCYFMYGAGIESLHLDAQIGTNPWIDDIVPPIEGQQQASPNDAWNTISANLKQYLSASSIRLRIRVQNGNWGPLGSVAIDDLLLFESSVSNDVQLIDLKVPFTSTGCVFQSQQELHLDLYNAGCDTIPANTLEASYSCAQVGGGISGTKLISKSLAPGEKFTDTLQTGENFSNNSMFVVEAEMNFTSGTTLIDADSTNNEKSFHSLGTGNEIQEFPIQFEDLGNICGTHGWRETFSQQGAFLPNPYCFEVGGFFTSDPTSATQTNISPCYSVFGATDPVIYLWGDLVVDEYANASFGATVNSKGGSESIIQRSQSGHLLNTQYLRDYAVFDLDSILSSPSDLFNLELTGISASFLLTYSYASFGELHIVERDSLIFPKDTLYFQSSPSNPWPKLEANIIKGTSYKWTNGDTTASIVVTSPGWHQLTVYDRAGAILHFDAIFVVIDGKTGIDGDASHKVGDGSTSGPTLPKNVLKSEFASEDTWNIKQIEDHINLIPNPAQDFAVLKAPAEIEVSRVIVQDINGRYISERQGIGQINLSALKTGVYIVRVETQAGVLYKRLLKR